MLKRAIIVIMPSEVLSPARGKRAAVMTSLLLPYFVREFFGEYDGGALQVCVPIFPIRLIGTPPQPFRFRIK